MFNGNNFLTWDQLTNYISNVLNISYDVDPTAWVDAMKKLTADSKTVKVVNIVTGDEQLVFADDNWFGEGEWLVYENSGEATAGGTASSSATTGGAASAPTAKSVYTDAQTKTAVLTEEATGVKNLGTTTFSKGINILSGLLQTYGLIHAGVKIYNSGVWRDMINEVFDAEIEGEPGADLMDKVINYLQDKVVCSITSLNTDGKLISTIPDNIAEKLYNFLSQHIILSGGTVVECSITNNLSVWYNFVNRQYMCKPNNTIEKYISVVNPETKYTYDLSPITDQFFSYIAADFIAQLIAMGFIVASSVATAFLENIVGLTALINSSTAGHGSDCNFCSCIAEFSRTSGVPKDTPVSLNELNLQIGLSEETQMDIEDTPEGKIINQVDFSGGNLVGNVLPTDALLYPTDYKQGDFVRYAKRSTQGNNDNEYGYWTTIHRTSDTPNAVNYCTANYYYSANEPVKTASYRGTQTVQATKQCGMNGYYPGDILENVSIYSMPKRFWYSNVGCKGYASGEPDDYLKDAGFNKKGTDKNPDPNKTKEQQYPGMANKIQSAIPSRTAGGGTSNVINNYTPSSVIYGDDNANRLIDKGMNNSDPGSYKDNRSQTQKQNGEINTEDPIDGYNEDTDKAVKTYNDSKVTPKTFPDEIPANEPNTQYPTNPPVQPGGETEDPPSPSTMEGVEASGMVSVYNPTKQELINFSAWLWSPNFLDNFLKLFQNPMDGIIGLHILYATPSTGSSENIRVGYLDSGVSAKVVNKQFVEIDCGNIIIPEYYGTAIDYEPYVQIHCYLPFVGIVSLKPNDVIGKKIYCKYGVDVLTGTCIAMITAKDKTSEILLYTFSGNCATQVPISGGNYAQVISGLATMAIGVGAGIATGNPIAAVGGVAAGVMSSHLDVSHSGSIGANAGAMAPRKPYVVVTRKSAYDANNYSQFYGYPANLTVTLGSCSGFTRVKSVHIDSIYNATDNEKTEIEALLKQGVIIK